MVAKVTLEMMGYYGNYGHCLNQAVGYYDYGVDRSHHGVVCYGVGCSNHGVVGGGCLHHGAGDHGHCLNHGAA